MILGILLFWVSVAVMGVVQYIRDRRWESRAMVQRSSQTTAAMLMCTLDSHCPEGHVCVKGECVLAL